MFRCILEYAYELGMSTLFLLWLDTLMLTEKQRNHNKQFKLVLGTLFHFIQSL